MTSSQQQKNWIRNIVLTALFAALFIVASFIKIPLGASLVPISLQSLAVMLAGGLLGPVYGFLSIFIVIALTATGLPLMNGAGGLAQLLGPTGGFIWLFPVAALLIGWSCNRLFASETTPNKQKTFQLFTSIFVFGSLLLYVTGVPWLAHFSASLDLKGAIVKGMLPYLPGDLIKAIAATYIISSLRPRLRLK